MGVWQSRENAGGDDMSCPTANMIPRDTLLCGTGIVMTMAFLAFATQLSAQTYLDPVHSGNNDGSVGMPWRWNETSANRIEIVDGTALTILINGAWDQFIDTPQQSRSYRPQPGTSLCFQKKWRGGCCLGICPRYALGRRHEYLPSAVLQN